MSTRLVLRDRVLRATPQDPLIMGILNASPESFSADGIGGLRAQLDRARHLLAAGADIIDIGGESGVTNQPAIHPDEEVRRVAPLVNALVGMGATVSVDTWKAAVARAVLDAGAHIINDVSGLRDARIAEACARADAGLVLMHTRAEPKTKTLPRYSDVAADVLAFLADRIEQAQTLGVALEGIVVDPGPDFAKTPAQIVDVLRSLPQLASLGRPILLAVSRKDFIGALTGRPPRDRLAGTLAAVGAGLDAGGSILRVHDPGATRDFLSVRAALRGRSAVPADLTLAEHLRRQPARAR